MKKLVLLFVFLTLFSLQAQDTASVEYTFTVTDEFNNSQELIIGKDPFGSDGLDPEFGEVVVPQVPAGQFGARLILPTDSTLTILKDIRFGCYWADGFEHNIDLSYATGSNQITIDWDWDQTSIFFLMSIYFYNPSNGNLIQWFEYFSDSSFFNVPTGLESIKMVVSYNGTLSSEWFSVINPNGGDTLVVGETYNISWSGFKMGPCIEIEFTSDGGNNWSFIQDTFCLNQLYYQWTVPNIISDSCRIRVGHYPCAYDTSDNYFSIVQITPVELLSFSSSVVDDDVTLNWMTATETNNSGFQIERSVISTEGRNLNWEFISFVNGNGTTTETKSYSYKDENLSVGKYQYRLKQIDFDGTLKCSNIIEAEILPPLKFSLEQNYPNPFNPSTKISWQSPVNSHQTLKIYDMLGSEIITLVDEFRIAGKYEVEFDATKISSGVYYYELRAGDFVQSKKMVLIK